MGCVVLQNKNILFSYFDGDNSCISKLDELGGEIFVLKHGIIGIRPHDIAVINDSTVAITSVNPSKAIVNFTIETRKVSKVIKTKHPYFGGISCFENNLINSCGKGLEMRSLNWKQEKFIL